jgi:hypothetical protein
MPTRARARPARPDSGDAMRTAEKARLEQLLAAMGVEDERTLPGVARVALRRFITGFGSDQFWVDGLAEALEHARTVGRLEGQAEGAAERGHR